MKSRGQVGWPINETIMSKTRNGPNWTHGEVSAELNYAMCWWGLSLSSLSCVKLITLQHMPAGMAPWRHKKLFMSIMHSLILSY